MLPANLPRLSGESKKKQKQKNLKMFIDSKTAQEQNTQGELFLSHQLISAQRLLKMLFPNSLYFFSPLSFLRNPIWPLFLDLAQKSLPPVYTCTPLACVSL